MKAAVYDVKKDPPELNIKELPYPEPGDNEVTVKIKYVGVNPIDYWISGGRYPISSPNRIVGSEAYGTIDSVGKDVEELSEGDMVSIYPWIFCGECSFCGSGQQNLCVDVGIVGGKVDGLYAEYAKIPEDNVVRVEGNADEKFYSTAGVSALTAYHAVKRAGVKDGEKVLVFGASGNVGMFLLQYAKMAGAYVVGVSSKEWIEDYGADERILADQVDDYVRNKNILFDVIFNPIGGESFHKSLQYLSRRGRLVTFGALTELFSKLDIGKLYRWELNILGSTGGTLEEFYQVVKDIDVGVVKPKIWKIFNLEDASNALASLFSPERNGKIIIRVH